MIIATLTQNAAMAQRIIASAVSRLPFERTCECASALKFALITRPDVIPAARREALAPIIGKYIQGPSA